MHFRLINEYANDDTGKISSCSHIFNAVPLNRAKTVEWLCSDARIVICPDKTPPHLDVIFL